MNVLRPAAKGGRIHFRRLLALVLGFLLAVTSARAAIQFDVFLGYDGVVPEASWFPVICEIKNDGPTFTGVVEVQAGNLTQGQTRRLVVELPTGTLKRVVIPVFSTARYQSSWDVRLLDSRGKVRAEQPGTRPRTQIAAETVIMGALPRTAGGLPVIRDVLGKDPLLKPAVARFQPALLPDNPLVFEGLSSLYLNSDKALELKDNQVFALLSWLNNGGHLIVAVEQPSDVTAMPWLRSTLPCELGEVITVKEHGELQRWVQSAAGIRGNTESSSAFSQTPSDPAFERAELQVVSCRPRNARIVAQSGDTPLILTGRVGRGQITALLFSPEREPVHSWRNLSSFWARLADVPVRLYLNEVQMQHGGYSADGIFGALIDSKQVRKLPVEWLLLLLIVYLVVIGPLDQYWLKRIKRPMLTWITFPCYVVLFSLLIYFIGYKLRAGESEWNELHVVDVLNSKEGAELRGRTYASIYSPVNATYRVENQANSSTFRGEFQSSWSGGQNAEKADVTQNGDNFKADIFVPVWTSQLYISDWWLSAERPLEVSVAPDGSGWQVTVLNHLGRSLTNVLLAIKDRVFEVGEVAAGQTKKARFGMEQGRSLRDFVKAHGSGFQGAVQMRQQAFGASGSGRLSDPPNTCMAASFLGELARDGQPQPGMMNSEFIAPPGLDLVSVVEHGQAVLLAWSVEYSPAKPMNLFTPRRLHKDTLWRVAVNVGAPGTP